MLIRMTDMVKVRIIHNIHYKFFGRDQQDNTIFITDKSNDKFTQYCRVPEELMCEIRELFGYVGDDVLVTATDEQHDILVHDILGR